MEITHSEISLRKSIIPIVLLISLLFYNIIFFENNDWLGDYTYHYILVFTSIVATGIGLSEKIKINLNGKKALFPNGSTVFNVIKKINAPLDKIAIELNKKIVNKKNIRKISLRNKDKIEIVHFIGGG